MVGTIAPFVASRSQTVQLFQAFVSFQQLSVTQLSQWHFFRIDFKSAHRLSEHVVVKDQLHQVLGLFGKFGFRHLIKWKVS